MSISISPEWSSILKPQLESSSFKELMIFLDEETKNNINIFPKSDNYFRALNLCPPNKIKVVILGQDPYHGSGQANGLSFSVNANCNLPPSLKNIFKELQSDLKAPPPINGDLTHWAKQGVLLLNSTLSVEEGKPGSHANKGWETITDYIIEYLSSHYKHLVFILWGKFAQAKTPLIDANKHLIICSTHPSPFSAYRGFFGSKPFSKANNYLKTYNLGEIHWSLNSQKDLFSLS